MQEAEFKAKIIAQWKKNSVYDTVFCIETEETTPGFPDVMARFTTSTGTTVWNFVEFKVSDKKGVIRFERSQPLFYKRHQDMRVTVIAFDNRSGSIVTFNTEELFDIESKHYMNMKLEVQL
jgi:hypothetical protein